MSLRSDLSATDALPSSFFSQSLTMIFWAKLAYVSGIGAIALWAVERLARPGVATGNLLLWLLLPTAMMGTLAIVELAGWTAVHRDCFHGIVCSEIRQIFLKTFVCFFGIPLADSQVFVVIRYFMPQSCYPADEVGLVAFGNYAEIVRSMYPQ